MESWTMSRAFADLAFTPTVRALQSELGSRELYASLDTVADRRDALTQREATFIASLDGFAQASVGETGWPYVQHRGGPPGFLKVLDPKTLGYADFRGNVQYVSAGNLRRNDRVAMLLIDHAKRRRLKILGHARLVTAAENPELVARVALPEYDAVVERAVIITVAAYDWNCPQHITPRFTAAEVEAAIAPLRAELALLHADVARLRGETPPA
jgi:predicted pyridoxine 5'-phosphate oxidase superfamily flavin-nucleotide-binding protein